MTTTDGARGARPATPAAGSAEGDAPDLSLGDVLGLLGPWRRPVLGATALAGAAALFEAAALVLIVGLAESVTRGNENVTGSLGPIPLELSVEAMFVLAPLAVLASTALLLSSHRWRSSLASSWTKQRRVDMTRAFLDADWAVQSRDRAGNLQALTGWVTQSTQALIQVINAGRGLSGVVVLLVTAALVNAGAALGIIVVGAVLFTALRPLVSAAKRWSRRSALLNREKSQELGEISEVAREIRVFDVGEHFAARSEGTLEQLRQSDRSRLFLVAATTPLYQAAAMVLLVGALGVAHSQGSDVDLAALGAVVLLVLRSVTYGQQLQSAYAGIHTYSPSMALFDQTMRSLTAAQVHDGDDEIARVAEVRFDGVGYAYDEGGEPALRGVDLVLRRGELVGLVGPSGAGKSTLAQLLLRLREPTEGQVLADGVPLASLTASSWYRQVSLVPQHVPLLRDTLRENIRFHRDHLDDQAVADAARLAGLDEVVASLPDGLDTELGRDRRDLSGGQLQRVGIARALAGRPSVLILDEPTSALDATTERVIHDTLEALRHDHLIVAIAHRLSTLAICDRVVSMVDGAVEADLAADDMAGADGFLRQALAAGTLEPDLGLAPVPGAGDGPTPGNDG